MNERNLPVAAHCIRSPFIRPWQARATPPRATPPLHQRF